MDFLLKSIFSTVYKSQNDALIELAYSFKLDAELDKYYKLYIDEELQNANIGNMEKKKRMQVLNLSLMIYKELLPYVKSLLEKNMLPKALLVEEQDKITSLKVTWAKSVKSYLQQKNNKKFILKEYEEVKDKYPYDMEQFIKDRQKRINSWAKDETEHLSSFYYIDDLTYAQKKAILRHESIFTLLKYSEKEFVNNLCNIQVEMEINSNSIENAVITVRDKNYLDPDGVGKIPFIATIDGVWRYGEITESVHLNAAPLSFSPPEDAKLEIIKEVAYKGSAENALSSQSNGARVVAGKVEMALFTAILQIGQNQLIKSNKITFTFNDIFRLWDITPAGTAYKMIGEALRNLNTNTYYLAYIDAITGELRTRIFHLINSIDVPVFNSLNEKEWTVEIDTFLRQQTLLNQCREINSKAIYDFRYDFTHTLFSMFISDLNEHLLKLRSIDEENASPEAIINGNEGLLYKEYTLNEISQRTGLDGKPSSKKKKIANSLSELKDMRKGCLANFNILDNGNTYRVALMGV